MSHFQKGITCIFNLTIVKTKNTWW